MKNTNATEPRPRGSGPFLLGLVLLTLAGCGGEATDDAPTADTGTRTDTQTAAEDTAVPVDTAIEDTTETSVDAAPTCTIPGALLCEDFESGKIDPERWTKDQKNGTLAVTTERKASGKYALHLRVEGPKSDMPNEASLHDRLTFPIAGNKFFGRVMVFVERNLPDKNFILVEARGSLMDGTPARYGLGGMNPAGEGQLFRLVYHPGDYVARSTSHPPVGRWACWEYEIDGANDEMRVWIDGKAMPEAKAIDQKPPWLAPAFRDLAIGFRVPHTDSHAFYDVFIDDIVIGTMRPGCPK